MLQHDRHALHCCATPKAVLLSFGHARVQASRTPEEDAGKAAAAARAVYGEPFADKAKRVQGLSPHGRRPGWAVRPIIVKSGDDCRQVRPWSTHAAARTVHPPLVSCKPVTLGLCLEGIVP